MFAGGTIDPRSDFDKAKEWIAKYEHYDGFIYPPTVKHVTTIPRHGSNARRPAHLFRLPASHVLALSDSSRDDPSREAESFVIHLLGYYFGGWYQFADWWFDARVPMKSTHNIVALQRVAEDFLSHSWIVWNGFPSSAKRRLTNVLFMLNRGPAYEWDWEHFVMSYMVFDGCYRIARDLKLLKGAEIPHSKRLDAMCDNFGIPVADDLTRRIVTLRNSLFHETLWADGRPGATNDVSAFFAPLHLRRLNQRLVPALLGYDIPYIRTSWWTSGSSAFDARDDRNQTG